MKRFLLALFAGIFVAVIGVGIWAWTPDMPTAQARAKYADAASRFVDLGGGLIVHVRDEGPRDAPVLLLIHGSNASLQTWDGWVARLGKHLRIVRFDLPAHGLTGPHPRGDYRAAAYVEVTDRLMTRLHVDRFAIAGNSMGGWVAWHYALAHPDRVARLILVDSSGAPGGEPGPPSLLVRLIQVPWITPIAAHFTPRALIASGVRQSIENQAVVTDAMIDRYWDLLRYPGNRVATIARSDAPRASADAAAIARLTMPVLILWGARDPLIPLADGRWFQAHIPHGTLIVYPGIGHIVMEETPERSAADVAHWLAGLPPVTPPEPRATLI